MLRVIAALVLMAGTAQAQSVLAPQQGGTGNNNSGAVSGNLPIIGSGGALGDSGYAPSGMPATATGSSVSRTLAARFADVVNILDFGADPTGATSSDSAFTAAIAQALTYPTGAEIFLPNGNYKLTTNQIISPASTQGILFEGEGPGITTITQSGQADAFDVNIVHYTTRNGEFVGFHKLTIAYTNATPSSTGVNVTSTAAGGQQGNPVYFDTVSFIGAWSTDINITALPSNTYVVNSTFFLNSGTTGISFQGSSSVYGVVLQLDNDVSWGGTTFLNVGQYVQGVVAHGINVAGASQAIVWNASAGAGEQFILTNSYISAGVYVTVSGGGSLTGVQLANNFFDGVTATQNELSITGVLQPQITGNVFFGNPSVGGTAINFGSGTTYGILSGNVFSGFEGGTGGSSINLSSGANYNTIVQNNVINTTSLPTDNGTSNTWQQNTFNAIYTYSGLGGNARGIGAADLQSTRTLATQVASGAYSAIMGGENNSSSGIGTVAAGVSNSSSGSQTMAVGNGNTASGLQSIALGFSNTASGSYGFTTGAHVTDRGRVGAECRASGWYSFAGLGSSQRCYTTLIGFGSTASLVRLTADGNAAGTANCINIPNNTAYNLVHNIAAIDHTTPANNEAWQLWAGLLTRGASVGTTSVTMATTPTPITNGSVSGSSISVSADTGNGCLNVSFTPPTGNTDQWDIVDDVTTIEVQ